MDRQSAGRLGGQARSGAKEAAARGNGKLGGRPSKAVTLVRDMRAMYRHVRHTGIDPHDLWLIVERLCRGPDSNRCFFLLPHAGGGYGF
jgi:hypothetical protein